MAQVSLKASLFLKGIWFLERLLQVNKSAIGAVAKGRAPQRMEVALRHWGWRKFFNFWRVEAQLRMGRTKVWGYPYEWEIDTTNICQLRCPLCHTGLGTIDRDKGVMHFDTYKKTIDEIKDYVIWLTLYSWGEPFLNKQIDKFVAYANEKNIGTIISSNLNKPLTPQMAEALVKSGLDVLIVSLDGVTQEVYEQYRVGGRLDRVLNNLRLLVEKKKELKSKTPFIEWQFIVMRQNEHQIEGAKAMAKELGLDNIVFKKVDFPHGEDDPDVANKWVPTGSMDYRRENPFDKPYKENGERCWRLWRSAVVNWDGGFAPCCYLTDKKDDFGDVKTHSVKEIWNNQRYVSARGLFNGEDTPSVALGCETCNVYLDSKAGRTRAQPIDSRLNGKRAVKEEAGDGAEGREKAESKKA